MPKKRGPWTVTGTRVVYKDAWISVHRDKVITPDKKKNTYATITFLDGSVVVPIDKERNVYLVRNFQYGIGKRMLEAPGGAKDRGESFRAAAKRELEEETGLIASRLTSLGTLNHLTSSCRITVSLFLAEGLTRGTQRLEGTETITVVRMPFQKALALVDAGKITDSETVSALLKAGRVLSARASRSLPKVSRKRRSARTRRSRGK